MQFPSDFIEKYNNLLRDEAEDFFASFNQEAVSAYRTNPLKSNRRTFLMLSLKHLGAITVKFLENLPTMQLVWFILRNQLLKWLLKWQLHPREVVF